jgi:hypothetical protein
MRAAMPPIAVGVIAALIACLAPHASLDGRATVVAQTIDRTQIDSKLRDVRDANEKDRKSQTAPGETAGPKRIDLCTANPSLPQCGK